MKKNKYPMVKFKWWYCLIYALVTIVDGVVVFLSVGWLATNLQFKFALWGAQKNIYRKTLESPLRKQSLNKQDMKKLYKDIFKNRRCKLTGRVKP